MKHLDRIEIWLTLGILTLGVLAVDRQSNIQTWHWQNVSISRSQLHWTFRLREQGLNNLNKDDWFALEIKRWNGILIPFVDSRPALLDERWTLRSRPSRSVTPFCSGVRYTRFFALPRPPAPLLLASFPSSSSEMQTVCLSWGRWAIASASDPPQFCPRRVRFCPYRKFKATILRASIV